MSQTTSIDFEVSKPFDAIEFIKHLEHQGWAASYDGKITYLPAGDDGMYDWRVASSNDFELVFEELQKKVLSKESIGVVLIDKETNCGGELLIWPDYTSFSLSLSIKSNELRESEYYIDKISESLASKGVELSNVEVDIL
tara:strand:+ start:56 stop:475 length:420 start_codon:yes stop_codon:yes gene_type:complete